jgi:TonB family protein
MAELLAGHSGDAEVTFTVNEQGIPETVTLDSASSPEFGKALVAATELSIFDSALKDGHSVNITMHRAYHFAPPAENPETGESGEIKVERELRAGQAIRTAKGLDHPLRPIWQMAPRIPIAEAKTEHPNAKAQIEVIIDEDGRVRAPKVVSASSDALGYAAATAVAQWCFDPPTRNGEATQVRVIVPLVFK